MDETRVDTIARFLGRCGTRRGAVRGALAAGLIVASAWLPAREAAARRQACQVRCGGDYRACKVDCRRTGAFARQCKRDCRVWRRQCFQRCDFKPIPRRLAPW